MTSYNLWILRSARPWRNSEAQYCAIDHDTLDYIDGFKETGGSWFSGEDFLCNPLSTHVSALERSVGRSDQKRATP